MGAVTSSVNEDEAAPRFEAWSRISTAIVLTPSGSASASVARASVVVRVKSAVRSAPLTRILRLERSSPCPSSNVTSSSGFSRLSNTPLGGVTTAICGPPVSVLKAVVVVRTFPARSAMERVSRCGPSTSPLMDPEALSASTTTGTATPSIVARKVSRFSSWLSEYDTATATVAEPSTWFAVGETVVTTGGTVST